MISPKLLPILGVGILVAALATASVATAQQTPETQDQALAYAQCMRDNGFTEFEDPTPEGDLRIQVTPESAPRFQAAGEACRDLAPEGFRNDGISPDDLEALVKLSQCIRENGIPNFPDPDTDGRFDLRGVSSGPGDPKIEAAMDACNDLRQGVGRIIVGG